MSLERFSDKNYPTISLKKLTPWVVGEELVKFEAKPWLTVTVQTVRLPDSIIIKDYYQIYSPSYVEICAKDARGYIMVLWRYKHGVRSSSLGFPAGYLKDNENPLSAAKRELHEECALVSDNWTFLGNQVIDGNRSTASVYFFLAKDCVATTPINSDDLEVSEQYWISSDELLHNLRNGNIKTLGAFALALLTLGFTKL